MKTALYELLTELEEYFDQRADIGDQTETEHAPPNDALIFRDRIREQLKPINDEEE
jgi:hypothetical protein